MMGRTSVFAIGLLVGVAAHSSYSCVRARAGDALALRDEVLAPIDVPAAVSTPRLPERPAERLPSAAEGDVPKGGAPVVAEPARHDYRSMLRRCAAAIGQCGYNTAIDWLQAGVPGVFVPFSDQ